MAHHSHTGLPQTQENRGFRLIHSQSTLIHQTAIGGKKLIKSTSCENPVPSLGVIDHFLQADLSVLIGQLPRSPFLDHFRVAGRVFPSFNQPTCTASIETEPPSTPSTGNVSGSDGMRVPAT